MFSHIKNNTDVNELHHYSDAVIKYQRDELSEEQLQVIRLQQGVYGQRQSGVYMLRIKLPGGRLFPNQLTSIAAVLDQYSEDKIVNITTRQDIQIHSIPLQDTPAALYDLAATGLTTREACGNTVRNICACPLAGVCAREHVDVQPYVEKAVGHFLRHKLTQHMPRKFKMSFSGCELDCAQAKIHDLGVVAIKKGNEFGFKVLAAGGLGHKPREAIVIEPFIQESELLPVIEAIIAVHNKYSDRKKRAKSRIKFLVDRFGAQDFIEKYKHELKRTRTTIIKNQKEPLSIWKTGVKHGDYQAGAPRKIIEQKQAGYVIFPVSVPLGDLTSVQLKGIASFLLKERIDDIRATQDQNLVFASVKANRTSQIRTHLQSLGLSDPRNGDNVVACPGTLTCRLGITSSRNIAGLIDGGPTDLRIRISGCHNGCAQPTVGDIGIHGEAKRLHGKLIPHYRMHFGGDGRAAGRIGLKGPEVPAARIDQAIDRVKLAFENNRLSNQSFLQWCNNHSTEYYEKLLSDLIKVNEADVPELLRDHGDNDDFKVLKLGGGECAGASMDYVAANFSEAAHERTYLHSFLSARKYEQAIECTTAIARLIGLSLLHAAGGNATGISSGYAEQLGDELVNIANDLKQHISEEASLYEPLSTFALELRHFKKQLSSNNEHSKFNTPAFQYLLDMLNGWTVLAAHYCQLKNQVIDLSPSLPDFKVSEIVKQRHKVVTKRELPRSDVPEKLIHVNQPVSRRTTDDI